MDLLGVGLMEWLSLLVSTVGAVATAILAVVVFRFTRKSEKNEITRSVQSDWRDYNLAILADKDLQKIEAGNHLFDDLTIAEVKKMSIYFIKLNVPYNMWIASNNDLLDIKDADREIANQSELLFKDRLFIEKHIFPRGYDDAFCELFRIKWKALAAKANPPQ